MHRIFLLLLAVVTLSACVGKEGVSLSEESTTIGVEEFLDEYPSLDCNRNGGRDCPTLTLVELYPEGLIMVGTTSAFRPFTAETIREEYAAYADFAKLVHPSSPPVYSQSEFTKNIAGWTKLKVFTIPLVAGAYESALVPYSLNDTIKFPSSFGAILVQEAGDLVSAVSNRDGFFVVDRLLCQDDYGYSECAAAYEKGVFDAVSGQEIDDDAQIKLSGDRIDVYSYKKIIEP